MVSGSAYRMKNTIANDSKLPGISSHEHSSRSARYYSLPLQSMRSMADILCWITILFGGETAVWHWLLV